MGCVCRAVGSKNELVWPYTHTRRSGFESGAATIIYGWIYLSIVLCHHHAHIDKLQLAHVQNSKLEKTNMSYGPGVCVCVGGGGGGGGGG